MASFVSKHELNESRNIKRKARQEILEEAKRKYEKDKTIFAHKKKLGFLSSVEKRLSKEADPTKDKKTKKRNKKQKKAANAEFGTNDHCTSSSGEDMWVEQAKKSPDITTKRDEWMQEDFLSGVATYSSKEVRMERNKERNSEKQKNSIAYQQPGQHAKELNPYWKQGGDGLPTVSDPSSSHNKTVSDVTWLKRSLRRMQEQCEESGKSIEDIAAERYGSWDAFKAMLEASERKSGIKVSQRFSARDDAGRNRRFMNPANRSSKTPSKTHGEHVRSSESDKSWKKSHGTESVVTDKPSVPRSYNATPDKIEVSSGAGSNSSEHIGISDMPEAAETNLKQSGLLSEQEKNKIGARIIKAELMGNTGLANKLKRKLEVAKQAECAAVNIQRNASSSNKEENSDEDIVLLTRTSKKGISWPVAGDQGSYPTNSSHSSKKAKKVRVHDKDGTRERYFADDDQYTLNDLVARERSGITDDHTETLSRMSTKLFRKTDGELFTLDDMFESNVANVSHQSDETRRNHARAISTHKKLQRRLEKCKHCFGNHENPKHLIMAIGRHSYVALPSHKPLQPGHCLIMPMHHCASATALDENVWEEIRKFMASLVNMFKRRDADCIFMQLCVDFKKNFHFVVECVPMPVAEGGLAPIYFKKAIQECENEWAQNKKLVDTRGKSVREKVPAGLPYFAVDFGMDGGFAHVIEDEVKFPAYFGREILGGMLDLGPQLWRRPHEEHLNEQTQRALQFEKWFKDFDWTLND